MSIIRHEIRKISDDNRSQPIISQAVVHGNVAYFAGITPNPIVGDIKTQTAQVLRRVDELLKLAGTDKSRLLSAQVWIADMRLFDAVAQGVVASNVVKTFPLRDAAAAHEFIGGRKTTGSIVMLPFE